jgi:hypothetical protein
MMIAAPSYICWRARGTPLTLLDMLCTVSFMFFFLIEIIADEQQWVRCPLVEKGDADAREPNLCVSTIASSVPSLPDLPR